MQASVVRERERLIGVVKEFGAARERYFSGVEQEVVKLALGIAERVLHREAQIRSAAADGRSASGAGKDGKPERRGAAGCGGGCRGLEADVPSDGAVGTAACDGGRAAGAGRVCTRYKDGYSGAGCERATRGDREGVLRSAEPQAGAVMETSRLRPISSDWRCGRHGDGMGAWWRRTDRRLSRRGRCVRWASAARLWMRRVDGTRWR